MKVKFVEKQASPPVIYAMALVLAACSLLYELLIAQALASLAANTVVWYSVTIGIYLAAMGMGALLYDRYGVGNLWTGLFRVELMLSAVGMVAVPILYFAHTFGVLLDINNLSVAGNTVFFEMAFLLTAAVGILTGFELPLLIDLGNAMSGEKRVTNRVLAADYMGSLLGGLAFPLLFVPNLSLVVVGLMTAGVNLIVALVALGWSLPKIPRPVLRLTVCGLLSSAIILGLAFSQPIERYFLKNYYFYSNDLYTLFGTFKNMEDVTRERSAYQRIDIVHRRLRMDSMIDVYSTKFIENSSQPRNYALFLNGDRQILSNYEEYYHEYFAHVPIATHGSTPRRVLVMGGGDGLLVRELIKYPDIETIIHVDLDRKLVEMAKNHPVLLGMNKGALDDPRVTTYFDDAYRYIRNSTDYYDAIFLDFPYAKDYNLSKLYSREFFHFVRKRLVPGGFIALDTPGLIRRLSTTVIYLNTIKSAGFRHIRPFVSMIEDFNRNGFEVLLREGYKPLAARRLLIEHAESLRQSFVIARDTLPDGRLYLDPVVKRHVLTDDRLHLTLTSPIPQLKSPDPKKVNSIFRPTLPHYGLWGIRIAW